MKFKYWFCLALVLLIFIYCNKTIAQQQRQSKIDSLSERLKNYNPPCNKPCLEDSSKVNLLNELATEIKLNFTDSAIKFAAEALTLSKKIDWQFGMSDSYLQLGSLHAKKGDFNLSKFNFEKSLSTLDNIEVNTDNALRQRIYIKKAFVLANMGFIYTSQANYPLALDFSLKALRIAEKYKDDKVLSFAYNTMGVIYRNEKEYAKSLSYYDKALDIRTKSKDKIGMASCLTNISIVYQYKNDYKMAHQFAQKALELSEEAGDKSGVARILGNIGGFYQDEGLYDKALNYYFKSLGLKKELGAGYESTMTLGNIAATYYFKKDFSNAIKYFKQSLSISDSIGDLTGVMQANQDLSTIFSETGNYKMAFEHYQKAMIAKDSIFNKEKTAEITRQEITYQFEKKQDSIKALQDKKDAIAKAEISKQKTIRNSVIGGLSAVVIIGILSFASFRNKRRSEKAELSQKISVTEMKALRSQMNPHFIFNALQSIQTFLLSHKSEEANTYLLKFSKLMRAVLENSQHSEVLIKNDIEALELYMQLESVRLKHPFTYQFDIDDSVDTENDTIPPLILQPFVENAIWHGLQYKNEPGHINIYLSKRDNALEAIVEDNGIGRDMSKKVAQPMLLKKESLGMKITEERLKVLNETKKVKAHFLIKDLFTKNNEPAGTKVELSLPLTA